MAKSEITKMIQSKIVILVLISYLFLFSVLVKAETVMIITGVVKDVDTGEPVSGVSITNDLGFSPILTNDSGKFSTALATSEPKISLIIHKEGYQDYTKMIVVDKKADVEIPLKSIKTPQLVYGGFVKNSHIYGELKGIPEQIMGDYKVLVYVLTDKWYIHPYATNEEGMGYASIQKDGTWRINTIYRGYQAYKVALLLVKKEVLPPSTVTLIKGDPEQELLSKVQTFRTYGFFISCMLMLTKPASCIGIFISTPPQRHTVTYNCH